MIGQACCVSRPAVGYSPDIAGKVELRVGEGRAGWVYQHAAPLVVGQRAHDVQTKCIETQNAKIRNRLSVFLYWLMGGRLARSR